MYLQRVLDNTISIKFDLSPRQKNLLLYSYTNLHFFCEPTYDFTYDKNIETENLEKDISSIIIYKNTLGNELENRFEINFDRTNRYLTHNYIEFNRNNFSNFDYIFQLLDELYDTLYDYNFVNRGGAKNNCFYIDKHNKKYNRKIIVKDGKKFVRYNNKIIELKEYKQILKKKKN